MTDPAPYMSGSGGAESAPGADLGDPVAEALAEALARLERRQRENAKRAPKTQEQRERDAIKARLRSCGRGIEDLAASLERIHADRSGLWHLGASLPLFQERMRGPPGRPRLLDMFERIEREAAAGCELSAAFVAKYGELLRLCDHMRYERPPPRAADYDPLETLTPQQRKWIKEAG